MGIIIGVILIIIFIDPYIIVRSLTDQLTLNSREVKIIISPLYNNPTSIITVFIVLYLFLTLIVIVSVTKFNKGPLRPIN